MAHGGSEIVSTAFSRQLAAIWQLAARHSVAVFGRYNITAGPAPQAAFNLQRQQFGSITLLGRSPTTVVVLSIMQPDQVLLARLADKCCAIRMVDSQK